MIEEPIDKEEKQEAPPAPIPWSVSWNPVNIKRWISLSKDMSNWNKADRRPNSSATRIFKIFERLENEIGEDEIVKYLMRPDVVEKARRSIPELVCNPKIADVWYKQNSTFPPCIKSILLDLMRDVKYGRSLSPKNLPSNVD